MPGPISVYYHFDSHTYDTLQEDLSYKLQVSLITTRADYLVITNLYLCNALPRIFIGLRVLAEPMRHQTPLYICFSFS